MSCSRIRRTSLLMEVVFSSTPLSFYYGFFCITLMCKVIGTSLILKASIHSKERSFIQQNGAPSPFTLYVYPLRFISAMLICLTRDPDYDWTDKRIAVIGNGSSAIQVIPALQPKASKLVNYVRHPTWISTNIAGHITKDQMGTNFQYTEEEKKLYRENPAELLEYRKYIERS